MRGFVLTDPEVAQALAPDSQAEAAREVLLVRQDGDDLSLSLYVDGDDLAAAARASGAGALEELGLDRLMRLAEGVSHFVLLAWRAQRDRPVSRLELELQAEVDKFLVGLLAGVAPPCDLMRRLFVRAHFRDGLHRDEARRYADASHLAHTYCRSLVHEGRDGRAGTLRKLRRFWRLGQRDKVAHIAGLPRRRVA